MSCQPQNPSPNSAAAVQELIGGKFGEMSTLMSCMEGYPVPGLPEEPQLNAPGAEEFDPQMFADMAKKMGIKYEY